VESDGAAGQAAHPSKSASRAGSQSRSPAKSLPQRNAGIGTASPVRPAPRSLKPSPGPLEIFADGLAIEIRRDDRVLYDSPLEGDGFELSVPQQIRSRFREARVAWRFDRLATRNRKFESISLQQ
jgi:hypothetical protein